MSSLLRESAAETSAVEALKWQTNEEDLQCSTYIAM